MRLRGVAESAARTARSMPAWAPNCCGVTTIVSPRYTIVIGRLTARWILRSAGGAVRPPTRVPSTFTPGAMTCVLSDAGAAVLAMPAATTTATAALNTILGNLVDAAEIIVWVSSCAPAGRRPDPSVPSGPDGKRDVDDRSVLRSRRPRAGRGARRLGDDGLRARPPRVRRPRLGAGVP